MILITGGSGFLGSALARHLAQTGFPVRCVGRRAFPVATSSADYVQCDLQSIRADSKIFERVHTIVHLASTTVPATSIANAEHDAASNIGMALRLLDAARLRGVRSFVFSSSGGTVYGAPARLPAKETDATDPLSPYGVVKLAIEKYVALYAHLYGIRGVSLRIGNPYGSAQFAGASVGVIARLLQAIHDDVPFPVWGDGSTVRDFLHIDDLLRAIQLAVAEEAVTSGVYNLGSGTGTSLMELIALAAEVTGKPPLIRHERERSIDVPQIYLDTKKFSSVTGWQTTIPLKSGMSSLWQELKTLRSSPKEATLPPRGNDSAGIGRAGHSYRSKA